MEKLKHDQIKDDTAEETPCSNCNLPNKKAVVRCLDCKELFCETCHACHNALKSMKKHKVVTVEDLRPGKIVLPVISTHQDQTCKHGKGETKKVFCETCEQLVCRDCVVLDHRYHQYISLKIAAKKHTTKLVELYMRQGEELKKKCRDAIQKTQTVESELASATKKVKKKLEIIKNEYHEQVDAIFNKHEAEAHTIEVDRAKELNRIMEKLKRTMEKVEIACDHASKVTGSDYDVTSVYSALSATIEEINKTTKPTSADETLGYVELEVFGKPEITDVVRVKRGERWEQSAQFSTGSKLTPWGIAVNPDGDVAVTIVTKLISKSAAKLFSKDGNGKYTFKGSFNASLFDIAITPDNRYILPGKGDILFHDSQGNQLKSTNSATYDINNKPSNPRTLAIDSKGRIVAGLNGNTISIHHADGQCISKFATPVRPRRLAITSRGDIAVTFDDDTLKVMDYSGNNVRVVQPPHGTHVLEWNPRSVCCSKQGEIFVVDCGDPKNIYRYTADGDQCLGCVVTGLIDPQGIAITEDGQQMFVIERSQRLVKIFQRQ